MKLTKNKKASDMMFLMLLIALIIGLVFVTVVLPLFDKISQSSKETVAKGICGGMLAIRSKMTAFIIGDVMKSSSLFSLSPSCGNAYTEPCKQMADCKTKIGRQIDYCWKMTRNDPSTQITCLYNLDINLSATPAAKIGQAEICPASPCTGTAVPKDSVELKDGFKANDGDSLSIEYDGKKEIVKCQGKCR